MRFRKNNLINQSRTTANITSWLKRETPAVRIALENASKHFDNSDALDVHTLEAIYARESSFGQMAGKRGNVGAAGLFQIEKRKARAIGLKTSASNDERKRFTLAAYNAGEGRIARAQAIAKENGDDPTNWAAVQKYLEDAGASEKGARETRDYVTNVLNYEAEFNKKSKANPKSKNNQGGDATTGAHWVTIHGRHILIKG